MSSKSIERKVERKVERKLGNLLGKRKFDTVRGDFIQPPPPKRRRERRKRKLAKDREMAQVAKDYLKNLVNPFGSIPVKLGYDTFTETDLIECYNETSYVTAASAEDGFLLTMNPDAALSSIQGATTTNLLIPWCNNVRFNGATPIASTGYRSANYTNLIAMSSTIRTISAAIKVQVSSPTTATGGLIGVCRFNGITIGTALDSLIPSNLMTYPQARKFAQKSGEITTQICWFPSDPADFTFIPVADSSNGVGIYNPIVIAGVGFPPTSRVTIEMITVCESQEGTLLLGPTPKTQGVLNSQPVLEDAFATPSLMWKRLREVAQTTAQAIEYGVNVASQTFEIINSVSQNRKSINRNRRGHQRQSMLMIEELKE